MRLAAVMVLGLLAAAAHPRAAQARPPAVADEHIVLHTSRGDLVLGLYDKVAPRHAAQILKLVRLGVYDSCTIFRVEPGYLAQLTDAPNRQQPLTIEQRKAIAPIAAEFSRLRHRAGTVSMAHDDGNVNSARTSFFFMLGSAPDLDGKYTVIGVVEWGLPLLKLIEKEPRDGRGRPVTPVVVQRAEVKTAQQIAQMRAAGELRVPIPLPAAR
jgi:cyclophilin family peptidyl-prolyl cis-trans isomerase